MIGQSLLDIMHLLVMWSQFNTTYIFKFQYTCGLLIFVDIKFYWFAKGFRFINMYIYFPRNETRNVLILSAKIVLHWTYCLAFLHNHKKKTPRKKRNIGVQQQIIKSHPCKDYKFKEKLMYSYIHVYIYINIYLYNMHILLIQVHVNYHVFHALIYILNASLLKNVA